MQPHPHGSTSSSQPNMSSPSVPLLRPPVPGGARSQSGARTPRLGLSIPASPNARPVTNGSNEVQPSLARPMPPALRLATPMGSNTTPQEGRQNPRGLPPLRIGTGSSAGGSSDASADSRSGSVGEFQARALLHRISPHWAFQHYKQALIPSRPYHNRAAKVPQRWSARTAVSQYQTWKLSLQRRDDR